MTIALVQQKTVLGGWGVGNLNIAMDSNVTSGNLLVLTADTLMAGGTHTFVVGDFTKASGTATIGSTALDRDQLNATRDALIYHCLVTGSGTLTLDLSSGVTDTLFSITVSEWSGSWNASALETTNGATGSLTNPISTGNMTSAGAALFITVGTSVDGGSFTWTKDTNWTQLADHVTGATSPGGYVIYRLPGSGLTDDGDWTLSPTTLDNWAASGAVFKETAGVNNSFAWIRA